MHPLADVAESLNLPRRQLRRMLDGCRITDGKNFALKDHDPADTAGHLFDHPQADALLAASVQRLSTLQELLYAQDRWSLLCIFQAMDAAGKDGTIKHVMSGVNPQGVQVSSFKVPGPEDLAHDFLWRCTRVLPERGRIGIFNRSYYEEVLVVRVHPELLERQRLPPELAGKKLWDHRLEAIADFEGYLARQGTIVLKFFLNISKEEQRKRFLARLEQPNKNWKFSPADIRERAFWGDYQTAFEQAIAATGAPHAPWFVVPADHKWFAHLVVGVAIIEALETLDLKYPELAAEEHAKLQEARQQLESEA
jgi:PPK2 family polyphosphate:nucleotide phosphotransferase